MIAAARKLLCAKLSRRPHKIYELAEALIEAELYSWSDDALVALYQKLFITQSALCELYFQLEEEGELYLHLTPVEARLAPRSQESDQNWSSSTQDLVQDSLRPNIDFFSDPANFFDITADDVKRLLESFWTRYQAHFSQHESLAILELDVEHVEKLDSALQIQSTIRAAYRKAAAKHHPDRGGDPEKFRAVRQAYEQLRPLF